MGGRAVAAAEYADDLCHAVCRGLVRQRQYEKESCIVLPKRGRNELKHLLKRLTSSHTATGRIEKIDQAHVQETPNETNASVEQDLDSFATRADRYRKRRRVSGVIQSAEQ